MMLLLLLLLLPLLLLLLLRRRWLLALELLPGLLRTRDDVPDDSADCYRDRFACEPQSSRFRRPAGRK